MPFDSKSSTDARYRTPAHRAARKRLLSDYTPGDPCCICGHPMYPLPDGSTSNLHADHDPANPDQYRGLAHGTPCQECGKRCNQVDGARRGRARQNGPARDEQLAEHLARWIL